MYHSKLVCKQLKGERKGNKKRKGKGNGTSAHKPGTCHRAAGKVKGKGKGKTKEKRKGKSKTGKRKGKGKRKEKGEETGQVPMNRAPVTERRTR